MKNTCFYLLLLILLAFSGCPLDINRETQAQVQETKPERKWTFIIYMAADNDLEAAAISNFNELEAVRYGSAPVSVIVLLDRSPYYDMTNGNWSGTRLYEIVSDPFGLSSTIYSPRLDCPELGLSNNSETELNTADPFVLSRLIDFAKRAYPAEHYALIMWGHGTGWRSRANSGVQNTPLKAVAIDDTHGQYMSLPSFGRAIAGMGLSLIGFDTCYGAILEVVYQIRGEASLFVGSEGEILSSGWNYTALFNDFLQKPGLSTADLGNSIQHQYSQRYGSLGNASISQIQLSQVGNLFTKFNDFSGAVASSITTVESRNTALDQVLHNVEKYYFTSFPSDLYVDVFDLSLKLSVVRDSITQDAGQRQAILNAANELETALSFAVPSSWAQNGTAKKIGVHVIPLQGAVVPASSHEPAYIRGSVAMDKNAFVEDSPHWAPNSVPQSGSLLDKLFYWPF